MALQERAMLVDLTIRQWTGRKHDKSVSAEVDRNHGASNAGRFNKQLVDKQALQAIATKANAIRDFHYRRTLPWGKTGQNVLPTTLYFEYLRELKVLRDDFDQAVAKFMTDYPHLVQDARQRLNTLFDPTEYPSTDKLRASFGVDLEILPIPSSADFRVDMADTERAQIQQEIEQRVQERQNEATKECYVRVREVLQRMKNQCVEGKTRITESLAQSVSDLAGVIDHLNIAGDPELTRLGEAIRQELIIGADDLRRDERTRVAAGNRASQLLDSIQG